MRKPKMVVTSLDPKIFELASRSSHKVLAVWAGDCAERVLPYFEGKYPEDNRPRKAVEAIREWVRSGVFRMADVRGASLAAHAAARDVQDDDAARSTARAAGQAVASAHVPAHAIAAANYAASAVRDSANPEDASAAAYHERVWQYQHLLDLGETLASQGISGASAKKN